MCTQKYIQYNIRVIVIKITNARTSIIGLLTDVAPVRHRCHIYIYSGGQQSISYTISLDILVSLFGIHKIVSVFHNTHIKKYTPVIMYSLYIMTLYI